LRGAIVLTAFVDDVVSTRRSVSATVEVVGLVTAVVVVFREVVVAPRCVVVGRVATVGVVREVISTDPLRAAPRGVSNASPICGGVPDDEVLVGAEVAPLGRTIVVDDSRRVGRTDVVVVAVVVATVAVVVVAVVVAVVVTCLTRRRKTVALVGGIDAVAGFAMSLGAVLVAETPKTVGLGFGATVVWGGASELDGPLMDVEGMLSATVVAGAMVVGATAGGTVVGGIVVAGAVVAGAVVGRAVVGGAVVGGVVEGVGSAAVVFGNG
jgi:hypothetical protein